MSTLETIQVEQQGLALVSDAKALVIQDESGYQRAGGMLRAVKEYLRRVAEVCEPVVSAALAAVASTNAAWAFNSDSTRPTTHATMFLTPIALSLRSSSANSAAPFGRLLPIASLMISAQLPVISRTRCRASSL